MAPKKEKVEKVSASAQEDMVLKYLKQQNRPYSATDISANLHNKVTKSNASQLRTRCESLEEANIHTGAAQKILIKLHDAKQIEGRVSGKQSVYHTIQNLDDAPTPEKLADMDTQTQALRDETAVLTAQAKTLRTELAQLNSSLSTADLRVQVTTMQAEKIDIEERLKSLRSGSVRPVSKEEKERVDFELRSMEKCVAMRQKIVKEMWATIAEMMPEEDWAELKEDFGIEI